MSTDNLQARLFQALKSKLPAHLSLVDEVAQVLDISTDSAYRRIRGEKPLALDEVAKLCTRYALSLDSLLQLPTEGFLFRGQFFQPHNFRYSAYLETYGQQMQAISRGENRQIFMLCKDIPVQHHYNFREIAAFKHYFWMRTFMNAPEFVQKKFAIADYPDELFELGRHALHYYNQSDSVEFWNLETLNNMLNQIEYYQAMNLFAHDSDVALLYTRLEELVRHIEKQADAGYKFIIGESDKPAAGFQLYYNEVILCDNSALVLMNGSKMAFVAHNIFNFMATTDAHFCDNTYNNIQNLMKKSTLISHVSERERAHFFLYLRNRIASRMPAKS